MRFTCHTCAPESATRKRGQVSKLDVGFIRSHFPAFSEPSLAGWAFFENAGGSYACRQVIDRLSGYYRQTKVQPYGSYPASKTAGVAMDHAYERLAAWLNVGLDEVHVGPSTSQNTYVLANAFREMWDDGDEIVVSTQDHEANAGVWRRLESRGIVVREWHVDPETGALEPSDLDALLSDRTRLVAFPHCSNIVAAINPVAEIADKAHAHGARVVVDGVSYAPHGLPDVERLGADVYLFSTYKTWGPHQGVMTVKRDLLDRLGNQSHFFHADRVRYKLVPAGPDHAQVAALAGVIEYLDAVYDHHFDVPADSAERGRVVHDLFGDHETELLARLLAYLGERDDVRIVGPVTAGSRAPTVSMIPRDRSLEDVRAILTDHRVMVGTGNFYGYRPLLAMGIPPETGVLRASFVHYTTHEEIDQLVEGLDRALG